MWKLIGVFVELLDTTSRHASIDGVWCDRDRELISCKCHHITVNASMYVTRHQQQQHHYTTCSILFLFFVFCFCWLKLWLTLHETLSDLSFCLQSRTVFVSTCMRCIYCLWLYDNSIIGCTVDGVCFECHFFVVF